MIAIVTEDDEGHYAISVRCYAFDGRNLVIAGQSNCHTLAEAQRAADTEISLLGHECSALCEPWPRAVTH